MIWKPDPASRALRFQFACSILANSKKTVHESSVKSLLSMRGMLLRYKCSSDPKHRAQRSYLWRQLKKKLHCRAHKWPLFTVESVLNLTFQTVKRSNLVKCYPILGKTAEVNDCGRITAINNIDMFPLFANNSSSCSALYLIYRCALGTAGSVMTIGLSINWCSNSKTKSCITSRNRKLGCSDLKSFTWFSQILLFSSSLKTTKGGSDHRLIVSLLRTFDSIVVKVVFLYICLRCVQERKLIFKARS